VRDRVRREWATARSIGDGRGSPWRGSGLLIVALAGLLALSIGGGAALGHGSRPAPTPTVDLTTPGDASQSQIAVDKWGNAIAAWTLDENPGAQNAGDLRVQASYRPAGGGFGAPVTLSAGGEDAAEPQVAISRAGHGEAIVAWTRGDDVEASSFDHHGFSASETVSDEAQSSFQPQVAIDNGGDAVAVWTRFDGPNQEVQAAFRPDDGSFGAPKPISDAGEDSFEPQVGMDAAGNALSAWTVSSDFHVESAFAPAGGSFGSTSVLSDPDSSQPDVAVSQQGRAIVVWNGPGGAIQSRFRERGGPFGGVETISATGAFTPKVGMSLNGNAVAVWARDLGTNAVIEGAYRPKNGTFGAPAPASEPGANTYEPQVAVAEDGDAIALWTRIDGPNLQVQSAFRDENAGFGAIETLSAPNGFEPQVGIDRDKNATAVWTYDNGGSLRIQSDFRPFGGSF
jgi:hypothetical protein